MRMNPECISKSIAIALPVYIHVQQYTYKKSLHLFPCSLDCVGAVLSIWNSPLYVGSHQPIFVLARI